MGRHAIHERANGHAEQPDKSESDYRPLSAEAWAQIRGGGENVSALRQGEGTEPEGTRGGQALIAEGKKAASGRETFIYVNNRLEGNALETIDAMLEEGE